MNDPVTTTARPGAASNVSTHAASATVPDDEDDSAVNYGPVPGHKAQRLPTNIYATFAQARALSGQARPSLPLLLRVGIP
ncbi:hypothetical protein PAXINDRAFT_8431 [Paxillus involutus ATCC 200175]|nr:hypothetical protein PAXINDRAFT_8431 [Paxillus involutus ATCC 200175]